MSGEKTKRQGRGRNTVAGRDTEKEPGDDETAQDGGHEESESLGTIREAVSAVVAAGLDTLRTELKNDLLESRKCFREDIKKQMDEFTSEIHRKMQDMTGLLEGVVERVGGIEKDLACAERWDIGVKGALTQLLANQRALQDKVTEMEGHSRRNNIRIYGIPEEAEGTSATAFVVDMIKTQLREAVDPNWGSDLGIERAHRALAPKPSKNAPPRSMVVRFLRFSVKESILHAAWKTGLNLNNKRVFFDHDYADAVQKKRKEYAPIKKTLKEHGIRFQTPLTRMRVHFKTGTAVYNNATQAAEDLGRRGLNVENMVSENKGDVITEETLAKLMPWEVIESRRGGDKEQFQQQVRERLKEYRRTETETAVAEEG